MSEHSFERSTDPVCNSCFGLWPSASGTLTRYLKCSNCHLNVHADCRTISRGCVPPPNTAQQLPTSLVPANTEGNLTVRVISLRDVNCAQVGSLVYGLCLLNGEKVFVKSSAVSLVESSCSWPAVINETWISDINSDRLYFNVVACGLFSWLDRPIANTVVSLKPLGLIPSVWCERWFPLQTDAGDYCGRVLLIIKYLPKYNRPPSSSGGLIRSANLVDSAIALESSMLERTAPDIDCSLRLENSECEKQYQGDFTLATMNTSLPIPPVESIAADILSTHETSMNGFSGRSDIVRSQPGVIEEPLVDQQNVGLEDVRADMLESAVKLARETGESKPYVPIESDYQPTSSGNNPEAKYVEPVLSSNPKVRIDASYNLLRSRPLMVPSGPSLGTNLTPIPCNANPDHAPSVIATSDDMKRKPTLCTSNSDSRSREDILHEEKQISNDMPSSHVGLRRRSAALRSDSTPTSLSYNEQFDAATLGSWIKAVGYRTRKRLTNMFEEDELVTSLQNVDGANSPVAIESEFKHCAGKITILVVSALKFNVADAAEGDYYVAVVIDDTGLNSTARYCGRTRTVQSSATPIFNKNFEFPVPHFRCSIRMTLVNAKDGKEVGSSKLPIYSIIMRDANNHNCAWNKAAVEEFKLRSGQAAIGTISAQIHFRENTAELFTSSTPYRAPNGPEDDFSVERLGRHIVRFQAAIGVVVQIYSEYCRLMDWDDPVITGLSLIVFIFVTLRINAEYAMCAPLTVLVFFAAVAWYRRTSGAYAISLVEPVKPDSTLFRPVGRLRIAVVEYALNCLNPVDKRVRPFVSVSYIPMFEQNAPTSTYNSEHVIGTFGSPTAEGGISSQLLSNFVTAQTISANETVIQEILEPWPASESLASCPRVENTSLIYPILQPMRRLNDDTNYCCDQCRATKSFKQFVPWCANSSLIKFSIFREKPTALLSAPIGHVVIPVKHLVSFDESKINCVSGSFNEVTGWFRLQSSQLSNEAKEVMFDDVSLLESALFQSRKGQSDAGLGQPLEGPLCKDSWERHQDRFSADWICLRLQLDLRTLAVNGAPSADDITTSHALQDIMFRLSERKTTSTISTLWNLRDNMKYVQNIIGSIVDNLETFKNIALWTSPSKTMPLFQGLVLLWVVTILVPGRYLILAFGLYEYFFKFIPEPEGTPMADKFSNFMQSIPNDDDLDQVYYWERKSRSEAGDAEAAVQLRRAKISVALKVTWQGHVTIRSSRGWNQSYLCVQGRRLVWWAEEAAVDRETPIGQLLLVAHSAVTRPSPSEEREIGADRCSLMLAIFGCDDNLIPAKCTLVCPTVSDRVSLTEAVMMTVSS